ncbi:hypothetical protein JQK87_19645 [Streptomyces sp. G44]|uniref:hypothetical protein n=1 Tax=Streptomyces sp. G44 TaxID=2807632 RepID=UPI0019613935|nr:hypothetical protein [Streptomyces sp. G44]MBM7170563.1 hypothetical protein [Streptomyces sp. G44]
MSGSTETIDMLKHTMVEQLMAVIAAPDDEDVARAADTVVRDLDALLRAEPGPAA